MRSKQLLLLVFERHTSLPKVMLPFVQILFLVSSLFSNAFTVQVLVFVPFGEIIIGVM